MYTRSMWDQLQIWEKFISLLASYLSLYAFHTYPLCFSLYHIVVHSELLAFFSVIDWWMSSCSLLERFNTMHTRCIWDIDMGLGHFCFLYTFSLFFFSRQKCINAEDWNCKKFTQTKHFKIHLASQKKWVSFFLYKFCMTPAGKFDACDDE